MGFEQLVEKVHQAEDALEARERAVTSHLQRARASWRAAWTPGRIVVAGLVAGFVAGRARPLRLAADGGQWMQMLTMFSGLLASDSAREAARTADAVADEVGQVAVPDAASTSADPCAPAA